METSQCFDPELVPFGLENDGPLPGTDEAGTQPDGQVGATVYKHSSKFAQCVWLPLTQASSVWLSLGTSCLPVRPGEGKNGKEFVRNPEKLL